jgi:hypothetical protein
VLALTKLLLEDLERRDGQRKMVPTTAPFPARRSSAARKRRARERERNGRAIFKVECDHDAVVLALLETGRISEQAALDRREVERALAVVLHDFAVRWRA